MVKPFGILTAALIIASLSARSGTGAPGDPAGRPREAASAVAPVRTQPLAPVRPGAAPAITSITPAVLKPGGEATITGSGFGRTSAANTVTVDGFPVIVTAASTTELTVRLPLGSFSCRATQNVRVSVRAGGATGTIHHPLQAAQPVSLQVGEVATPARTGQTHCLELEQTGGQYLIGVVNALTDSVRWSFQLHGAPGDVVGAPISPMARDTGLVPSQAELALPDEAATVADSLRRVGQEHMEHLERERARADELRREPGEVSPMAAAGTRPPPREGEVVEMRVRNHTRHCRTFAPVSARVVWVGPHAVILEDEGAPLAGTMDADYRALGEEFERKMWGIVENHFGSPLAMDGELDADGRVRMLFTSKVTELDRHYLGFVTSCDFGPRDDDNAASNVGEVFYATVPSAAGKAEWLRTVRPVIVHELKHLAAYAQRLAQGGRPEQAWLEEATAMAAAELYARTFSGAAQRGNAAYDMALRCEVEYKPTDAACSGWPLAMTQHFAWLMTYLTRNERESVFWQGYGGGWSLVRWAADLSAQREPEFFSGLVQNLSEDGAENLAAALGRPFSELIVDWLMASALDDALDPQRVEHSLPGWNTRDIYAHLHQVQVPGARPAWYPLSPRHHLFGEFAFTVWNLPNATAAFVELSGTQSARQLVWITRSNGTPLPDGAGLRLAVARIQ